MPTSLRWIASVSTSSFHVASALLDHRRGAADNLAAAVIEPATRLHDVLIGYGIPNDEFFRHLLPLSADIDSNRELALAVLTKIVGRAEAARLVDTRLTGALGDVERAMTSAMPGLLDELALRAAPLRQQWEARGAGMLRSVARQTEPDLLVQNADVILVQPFLGGDGAVHPRYNSVRIEAVLADACAELPEVVRLGWLLSLLNHDLPIYSDQIPAHRRAEVAGLAMLMPVLSAAEEVELTRRAPAILQKAIDVFHAAAPEGQENPDGQAAESVAETLAQWWQTYLAHRSAWPVALAALDKMLHGPSDLL